MRLDIKLQLDKKERRTGMRNKKINWVLVGGGFLMLAMGNSAVAMQKGMQSKVMRMDNKAMARMDSIRMSRLIMAGMQRHAVKESMGEI